MVWLLLLEDGDGTIRVHRDQAGRLQLLDHLVSVAVVSSEILHLCNLGLKGLDSGKFCLDIGLISSFLDL